MLAHPHPRRVTLRVTVTRRGGDPSASRRRAEARRRLPGLRRLLGDGADGVLGDVALAACHCEMLARGSVDRWGKPRNGLPQRGSLGPGLPGRGGPATIVWRLVSQRNQRIDRPPFDLVTPPPNPAGTVGTTQSGGGATCHRGRPWYTRGARGCPRALHGRPGTPGLVTPDGLGSERESHLLAMPGGLAGQPVPGSQSESLRRHPARTSGGFGNSGTSEKGDKPHPRPERSVLLAVDQEFGECATLWVAPELSDPVGSLEVGQHEDVEQLGERGRARPLRAEPTLANHHPRVRCRCHPSIRCPAHRVRVLASVCSRPGWFR